MPVCYSSSQLAQLHAGSFFKAVPMASITVDMMHVDQDIADSEAANIWEYVSDILASGATHDEMLVALGMVIEEIIEDAERHGQMADT